jgi:hypothetical protein
VKLYVAHEPSGAAHFYGWYKASNGARGSVWGEALPPLSREFAEIAQSQGRYCSCKALPEALVHQRPDRH